MAKLIRPPAMLRVLALSCGAAVAVGCAGSHSSLPSAPRASAAASATATINIAIPRKGAIVSQRRLSYVSINTQSVSVQVNPQSGPALSATTISCTATLCSGTVPAPIGTDTFLIQLFSGVSGSGSLLSTASTQQKIAAGNNSVNLTLNPVVASVSLSLAAPPAAGTPLLTTGAGVPANAVTSEALNVAIFDGSSPPAQIIGPGSFVNASGTPITISFSNSDTSGATCLSLAPLSNTTTSCPAPVTPSLAAPGSTAPTLYLTLLASAGAPTPPPFDDPNITVSAPGVSALTGLNIPVSPTVAVGYGGQLHTLIGSMFGSDAAYAGGGTDANGNEIEVDGIFSLSGAAVASEPVAVADIGHVQTAALLTGGFANNDEWFVLEFDDGTNQFRHRTGPTTIGEPDAQTFTDVPATTAVDSNNNLWFSIQSNPSTPKLGFLNVSPPASAPTFYPMSSPADQATTNPDGVAVLAGPPGSLYLVVWKGTTWWIDTVQINAPAAQAVSHIVTPSAGSPAIGGGVNTIGYSPIDRHVYIIDATQSAYIYDVDPASGVATALGASSPVASNALNVDPHKKMVTLSDGSLAYISQGWHNPRTDPQDPLNGAIIHIVPNRKPNPLSIIVPFCPAGTGCQLGDQWGMETSGNFWDSEGGGVIRAAVW